jgi:uncharacterized protein YndB with AHSA1/START domain
MKNTWSEFKLRVNINTSVEKAYRAWATPQGLETWFLSKALFKDAGGNLRVAESLIQKGDNYEWYWHGHPDSVVEKGKVLTANEKNKFSFTFSMGCPVSISIYSECDEIIVELQESDLPVDEETKLKHYLADSKGWLFYLSNLKSVLEGGLDLRNKKIELTNVITA